MTLVDTGLSGSFVEQSKMETKKLNPGDLPYLKDLVRLYADVFEEEVRIPADDHLQSLLELEHMIFYVALRENRVAGGLTAHVLPSVYFPSSEVYVYDLAVDKEYQRQGIGAELMGELENHCRGRGYREIFVQADAVDEHALNFYEKIGGSREDVFHFSFAL